MSLTEHKLFLVSLHNIEPWLPSKQKTFDDMGELLQKPSLPNLQRYELDSFYWCLTCVSLHNRLVRIHETTGRSIYLKKAEEKGTVIKDWLKYNYQYFVLVYQSALDVALLLVNAVLDLGIPYSKCTYDTIYKNRKTKDFGLLSILKTLKEMTDEHRQGKNLLLHRGKAIATPIQITKPHVFDIGDLAKSAGVEETRVITYLEEFLSIRSREDLLLKMADEIFLLEQCILTLFGKLLPIYESNHSLLGSSQYTPSD